MARPISYSGGSTLMAFSNDMKDSLYYHYSPTYKYSVGIEALSDHRLEEDYANLRFTYLLNRKNTANSQRNLYFQSGIRADDSNQYFFGLHGDWETKRWLAGFDLKQIESEATDYNEQSILVGVAPYIGDYGDLHTWFLLKTQKTSIEDKWITYPTIKLFKNSLLMEIGYHDEKLWNINLIYRL